MKLKQIRVYGVQVIKTNITGDKDKKVCSFDVDEETKRHEPWTGSNEHYKANLDAFLSGGIFTSPSGNGVDYDYSDYFSSGSFINQYKDTKFIESLGEYTYNASSDAHDADSLGLVQNRKKRVIIYTEIP